MDQEKILQEAIRTAYQAATPLEILGAGSRRCYGHPAVGEALPVSAHQGILEYYPDELVIHARAGTPLRDIEAALAEHGQCLAFDPVRFQPQSTLGGMVAMGLAGPARPWRGAIRDHLLGVKLLDGRGNLLNMGGRVVKNVAGYDLFRPMAGAMGTLGLMLEITLRVWPKEEAELSLRIDLPMAEAIEKVCQWSGQALPLAGAAYQDDHLRLRLAGSATALTQAQQQLPGQTIEAGDFWADLRDHRLPFFQLPGPLWRLSLPANTPPLLPEHPQLLDWGGAQRWLQGPLEATKIHALAQQHHGHAYLFKGPADQPPVLEKGPLWLLQQRLRTLMDPKLILNRGRLFPGETCKPS